MQRTLDAVIHCSAWRDDWSATLDVLEKRDIDAINMALVRIDEDDKRVGPTGKKVIGVDYVIADHDLQGQPERRGNLWCIDTGAGFPGMNRVTLPRIDGDPPAFETFEVRES